MRLFKHSTGMILAFGFDPWNRCVAPAYLCWSSTFGGNWEPGKLGADRQLMDFDVAPEFVHELADRRVIAYQPGRCIELTPNVKWVLSIRVLTQEHNIAETKDAA